MKALKQRLWDEGYTLVRSYSAKKDGRSIDTHEFTKDGKTVYVTKISGKWTISESDK